MAEPFNPTKVDRRVHSYDEDGNLIEIKPEPDTSFREQEVVNGVDMSVAWDDSYRAYTLYFPGIDLSSDEARDFQLSDQVVIIGETPGEAREVFGYAQRYAEKTGDPYEVAQTIWRLVREVNMEEDATFAEVVQKEALARKARATARQPAPPRPSAVDRPSESTGYSGGSSWMGGEEEESGF